MFGYYGDSSLNQTITGRASSSKECVSSNLFFSEFVCAAHGRFSTGEKVGDLSMSCLLEIK